MTDVFLFDSMGCGERRRCSDIDCRTGYWRSANGESMEHVAEVIHLRRRQKGASGWRASDIVVGSTSAHEDRSGNDDCLVKD